MSDSANSHHDPRSDLRADCYSCVGLCCVVPAFSTSADFALDKPARSPCPNLAADFCCSIHSELRERGFPGCTVYDCFGAGQRVVQRHFSKADWKSAPEVGDAMFAAFEVVERMHELLWYLADALARPAARRLRDELEGLRAAVEEAARFPDGHDVAALQRRAAPLLGEVSTLVRGDGVDLRRKDLSGRDLRDHDLVAANLRGTLLLGADLRGCDLTDADLFGADLRGTDVRGADLAAAVFLTQLQVNAATGDQNTRLNEYVRMPGHWRGV